MRSRCRFILATATTHLVHVRTQRTYYNINSAFLFNVAPEAIKLPSAQNSLPIVLDINGDMKTDLLGYSKDTNELSVWTNTGLSDDLFNL